MSASPFNSVVEISARITVILAARPHLARDERTLAAIDLLTTNRGDYSGQLPNLHGHSMFYANLATRLGLIRRAIPFAVTRGLITPHVSEQSADYTVTQAGKDFANRLTSSYFSEYTAMLTSTLAFVDSHTAGQVLDIFKHAHDQSNGGNKS